jgi:hypothetical protein
MQTLTRTTIRAHSAGLLFTSTLLVALAAAALLGACGGAGDGPPDAPSARAVTATEVVLDVDALGSAEAAAQQAASARGAPGENEPVRFLVRARQRADAQGIVDAFAERGFAAVVEAVTTAP